MEFEEDPWISNIRHNHPSWPGACFTGSQTPFLQFRWMSASRKNTMNFLSGSPRHWPGGFLELTRPPLNGRGKEFEFWQRDKDLWSKPRSFLCKKGKSEEKKKKRESVYMGNDLIEQKVSHCPTGGGLVSGQQPSFFAGCPSVGTMFAEVLEGVKDLVGG